jgi:hypothetical protein
MAAKDKYDWSKYPLGKMTDSDLSRKYGIPVSTISRARTKRGIDKFASSSLDSERFDWGKLPLGEKSDADIAREFGLKSGSVSSARRRRGIISFVEPGHRRADARMRGIDWDSEVLLGKVPDKVLQKKHGLKSVGAVSRARTYRGIPKFKPPTHAKLIKMYEALSEKWDSLAAVDARHKELLQAKIDQLEADAKVKA